jgi:phenylalanine-4-hydroxylase
MADDFRQIEPGILRCPDPDVPGGYRYCIEDRILRELGEPDHNSQPIGLQKYPHLLDSDGVLQPFIEVVYSQKEHERWSRMFTNVEKASVGRTTKDVVDGLAWIRALGGVERIPALKTISDNIEKVSGFKFVPALGLVSSDNFFKMLMDGKFPVTLSLRREEEIGYTSFPDIFHDIVGHVPMFLNKDFCDFARKIGAMGTAFAGQSAPQAMVAKIYWYTIEFGLKVTRFGDTNDTISYKNLQVYGAGIASSAIEMQISVEADRTTGDRIINRLPFDLERLLLSHYEYEKPQELYFVIESYSQLAELFAIDLKTYIEDILEKLCRGEKTLIPQGILLPGEDARVIPPNRPAKKWAVAEFHSKLYTPDREFSRIAE